MPVNNAVPPRSNGRTPTVVKLLVLSTFVAILNETIMINAIPRLMTDWRITEPAAQWVSTVFMLGMASVIPVTGWFLRRVTTGQAYAVAMGLFLSGTVVSAAAPLYGVLLGGRAIQAAGTAVLMPLLMTTLMTVVPASDRGRVMGNVTMAISVAPALGPAVSGLLLSLGSWRLLFLVILPIAGAITWLGLRNIENVGEQETGTIDWFSVVVAALGFGGLVYGLTRFGENRPVLGGVVVAAGVLTIAVFVVRQLRLQRGGGPLMDLRTFGYRSFTLTLVLMTVAFMAMLGTMMLLPLYLQNLRDLSPLATGLLVMPGGLLMGLLGPTVGRLFDRFGGRPLVIPGSVGIVVALSGFGFVSMTMPYWLIVALHMLLMVSLAAIMTPTFTLGLGSLPPHLYSYGSSILGTLQQVSAAFGTALVVTVMTARSERLRATGVTETLAQLGGMRLAFAIGAGLALAVVAVAVVLPGRPPSGDRPGHSADEHSAQPREPEYEVVPAQP